MQSRWPDVSFFLLLNHLSVFHWFEEKPTPTQCLGARQATTWHQGLKRIGRDVWTREGSSLMLGFRLHSLQASAKLSRGSMPAASICQRCCAAEAVTVEHSRNFEPAVEVGSTPQRRPARFRKKRCPSRERAKTTDEATAGGENPGSWTAGGGGVWSCGTGCPACAGAPYLR